MKLEKVTFTYEYCRLEAKMASPELCTALSFSNWKSKAALLAIS